MFSLGEHAYYFYSSLIELNGGTQLLSNICEARQWEGCYRKSATFLVAPIDIALISSSSVIHSESRRTA